MLQFSPPPEAGVGQALLPWVPALAWGCVPVRRNVEHSQAPETAFINLKMVKADDLRLRAHSRTLIKVLRGALIPGE